MNEKIDRLKQIVYQLEKDLTWTPTDEEAVKLAQTVLNGQIDSQHNVVDSEMPTEMFGATLDWSAGGPDDHIVTITKGLSSITQDLTQINFSPLDITNLQATVDGDSVTLTWTDSNDPGLDRVDISWTGHPSPVSVAVGTQTYTASGLAVDTEYEFLLRSVHQDGHQTDGVRVKATVPPPPLPFITTWQTDATGTVTSGTDQVKLPLNSTGTYNFTVDWGDGTTDTITSYNQAEATHTYAAVGSYDITIDGTCDGWGFTFSGEDNSKLTGIKQWGNVKLHDGGSQFYKCDNISSYTATDVLDTSNVTSMSYMFNSATLPAGFDASGWTTSGVTDMGNMFYQATLPAGFDISLWNTSSVTNMFYMFNGATLPTGFDISGWNTSGVTDMYGVFRDATLPTGFDISTWNTSSVTNMSYMFRDATLPTGFDASGWTTSGVTDMSWMFSGVTLPTGFDISTWDTSSVTTMIGMFNNATLPTVFDISLWNTLSVTNMGYMFNSATLPDPFDLSGWCVTNMASEPSNFGTFNGTTQLQPVWGTCPGS